MRFVVLRDFHVNLQDNHEDFMNDFLLILRSTMVRDINNEYASNVLGFCAKFVAVHNTEETHPLVTDVFSWLLEVNSLSYLACLE